MFSRVISRAAPTVQRSLLRQPVAFTTVRAFAGDVSTAWGCFSMAFQTRAAEEDISHCLGIRRDFHFLGQYACL